MISRDLSQNYFKGFLVIGMIVTHSLQMLTVPQGVFFAFSVYINLITFAGFMFSFGYVYQIALCRTKNRLSVCFN
ncbi:MAG: hypothetical protein H7Y13_07650 [Sphingobacteriaceae bacterium]|nr:hypothetical protein [Sphingobacteriaceae bacterium]